MIHLKGEIDRHLASGLAAADEESLREHLRACAVCRAYHDEQVRLLRALAGDPERATEAEERRLAANVVRAAGLPVPVVIAPAPGAIDRLLWPGRRERFGLALALTAAGVLLLATVGVRQPPAIAFAIDGAVETRLVAGAWVEAREAPIELRYARGARLNLEPGSRGRVGAPGDDLLLQAGRVRCDVDAGRGEFAVITENARARVLGTRFVVDHVAGSTSVVVEEGRVAVHDARSDAKVEVAAGQYTSIASGGVLAPPSAARGFLDIAASPWAEIRVDGRHVDTTPLSHPIELSAGRHEIELVNPVSARHVEQIEILLGKTVTRKVKLEPVPTGFVLFEGSTPKTLPRLDGRAIALGAPAEVAAGEHLVERSPECAQPRQILRVEVGRTVRVPGC